MCEENAICCENIDYNVNWKYSSFLKDDFEIVDVSAIKKEIYLCRDSTQYIMRFVEILKEKVIRTLQNLHLVKITIGVFDEKNVIHRLMVGAYKIVCNILKRDCCAITHLCKTIFTVIQYEDRIVFMGSISFDGII